MTEEPYQNKQKTEEELRWQGKRLKRTSVYWMNHASINLSTNANKQYVHLQVHFPTTELEDDICIMAHHKSLTDTDLIELIDQEAEALFEKLVNATYKAKSTVGEAILYRQYLAVSRAFEHWFD